VPRARRWPASYDQFWGLLKEREGRPAGTRATIDVLLLGREYGPARLRRAVEEALELGCPNVGSIRYLPKGTNLEQGPAAAGCGVGLRPTRVSPSRHTLHSHGRVVAVADLG